MSKKGKIILIIVILLLIFGATALIGLKVFTYDKEEKVIKKVDEIKGYAYHLEDRDTKLYKDEFKILKDNLESSEIDYEEYAKSIAKMFIIDLYTIDNKINKYDIGGLEFIHPDNQENYQLNVEDTLYKYILDNTDDNREQELPVVKEIEVNNTTKTTYTLNEKEYEAYEIELSWEYEEDLDYDEEAKVIVIKDDKTMYVVEKSDLESGENKNE